MPRKMTACLALLATLTGGCASDLPCHGGRLIAEYRANEVAEVAVAPCEATCALYRWDGPPEAATPRAAPTAGQDGQPCGLRGAFRVLRGARVGFEKGEDGQLFAVAGKEKLALTAGRYCWHITPESEPSGGQKALWAVNDAGEALVMIAGGVCMLPLLLPFCMLYGAAPGTRIY